MKYQAMHAQIVLLCSDAVTYSQVESALGLSSPNGQLRRYIKANAIPMPNYRGQRAANALSRGSRKRVKIGDFRRGILLSNGAAKRFLLRNGFKQEICEICGWCERRPCDGRIPLHLHHRDGDG